MQFLIEEARGVLRAEAASPHTLKGLFESGLDCVYLTDEQNRYTGLAVQKGRSRLEADGRGGWRMACLRLPYLTTDMAFVQGKLGKLRAAAEEIFAQSESLTEILIVSSGGGIRAIIRKKLERLDIVTSCDNGQADMLEVPLLALSRNLPDKEISYHLLHRDIPDARLRKLERFCEQCGNIVFHGVRIPEEDETAYRELAAIGSGGDWDWGTAAYYSLQAWRYLPELDRALYLDAADTLVLRELDEFYFSDFEGMEVMASLHHFKPLGEGKYGLFEPEDLSLPAYREIILADLLNSGVYLMNLAAMRRTAWNLEHYVALARRLQSYSPGKQAYWGDQGLLSAAFLGRLKAWGVPAHGTVTYRDSLYTPYNLEISLMLSHIKQGLWYEPHIVHFTGHAPGRKPWTVKWELNPVPAFSSADATCHLDNLPREIREYYCIWHEFAIAAARLIEQEGIEATWTGK